jgi:hypothetical protein
VATSANDLGGRRTRAACTPEKCLSLTSAWPRLRPLLKSNLSHEALVIPKHPVVIHSRTFLITDSQNTNGEMFTYWRDDFSIPTTPKLWVHALT